MTLTLAQLAGSFVAPLLAGAGLLAVALPVAIHLLSRLRRKRQAWGAMRFLRLAYQKQRTKVRLEQWLLLLTRCALMLLIGLALAGPVLSGAWSQWRGGGGGRLIVVVVDDSLSSGARLSEEATWWSDVSSRASALIASANAEDRIAVWSASRPAREVCPPSSAQVASQAVASLTPSHGSADWSGVQSGVRALLAREGVSAVPIVAVVSPWARGDGALMQPIDSADAWPAGVSAWIDEPAVGLENMQVASLTPARNAVIAQGVNPDDALLGVDGEASVSVVVRRFGGSTERANATLSAQLMSADDGRVLVSSERRVTLSAGQVETTAQVALPLDNVQVAQRGGAWIVARLNDAGGALEADDVALGWLELRPKVRVGLWDPTGEAVRSGDGGGLAAEAFMRSALSPGGGTSGAVEVLDLRAVQAMDEEQEARGLDAVVVLGADRLNEAMVLSLRRFASQGAWVIAVPGNGLDTSAADTQSLTGASSETGWIERWSRAMGLQWRAGAGVLEASASDDGAATATGSQGWSVSSESLVPAELSGLSSDWRDLVGPVRVSRHHALEVPAGEAWMRLNGGGVLLATSRVGRGRVLLFTASLETSWTNLPAKPMFPALLQELARAAASGEPLPMWMAGDVPTLEQQAGTSATWSQQIDAMGRPVGSTSTAPPTIQTIIPLDASGNATTGGSLVATQPARVAGGYQRENAGVEAHPRGGPIVVRVEASAGNTATWTRAELAEQWDARASAWRWLPSEPGEALATGGQRTPLGRTLLWAVLALLAVETVLGRRFSHAESSAPSLRKRTKDWLQHLRHHTAADA